MIRNKRILPFELLEKSTYRRLMSEKPGDVRHAELSEEKKKQLTETYEKKMANRLHSEGMHETAKKFERSFDDSDLVKGMENRRATPEAVVKAIHPEKVAEHVRDMKEEMRERTKDPDDLPENRHAKMVKEMIQRRTKKSISEMCDEIMKDNDMKHEKDRTITQEPNKPQHRGKGKATWAQGYPTSSVQKEKSPYSEKNYSYDKESGEMAVGPVSAKTAKKYSHQANKQPFGYDTGAGYYNERRIPANVEHEKELKNASLSTKIDELLEKAEGKKFEPLEYAIVGGGTLSVPGVYKPKEKKAKQDEDSKKAISESCDEIMEKAISSLYTTPGALSSKRSGGYEGVKVMKELDKRTKGKKIPDVKVTKQYPSTSPTTNPEAYRTGGAEKSYSLDFNKSILERMGLEKGRKATWQKEHKESDEDKEAMEPGRLMGDPGSRMHERKRIGEIHESGRAENLKRMSQSSDPDDRAYAKKHGF